MEKRELITGSGLSKQKTGTVRGRDLICPLTWRVKSSSSCGEYRGSSLSHRLGLFQLQSIETQLKWAPDTGNSLTNANEALGVCGHQAWLDLGPDDVTQLLPLLSLVSGFL